MFAPYCRHVLAVFTAVLAVALFPATASADHSWGSYHWSTSSLPLKLALGDNLSGTWATGFFLRDAAINPWNAGCAGDTDTSSDSCQGEQPPGDAGKIESKVEFSSAPGGTLSNVRKCWPTAGRVEVCNTTYGNNGWLGVAQIWVSGSHITQGTVKLNDTYFNTSTYNTTAWRNLVMCQEVGHTIGLDHQDEAFSNGNLGTCMDYTNKPEGPPSNQRPNYHDFEQLQAIYHTHEPSGGGGSPRGRNKGRATLAPGMTEDMSERAQWGRIVRQVGRTAVFERDFGGGHKVFTFVIWAD